MVVVGQVDFQANQLSWLYLLQIGVNVCACVGKVWGHRVCVCVYLAVDGNLICVFWARGIRRSSWGDFISRTYLASHHIPHPVHHISQTRCIQRIRTLLCTFPSLWNRRKSRPWGQIVAHVSMLQNFGESIHQHVAESIRPCLIHFLRKIEGSDEEEIHYLVARLVFEL